VSSSGLIALWFIVAGLFIALIVVHSGKDAGMARITGFSVASSARVMGRNLTRYAIICGVAWFVTTFLLVWRIG